MEQWNRTILAALLFSCICMIGATGCVPQDPFKNDSAEQFRTGTEQPVTQRPDTVPIKQLDTAATVRPTDPQLGK